MKLEKLAGKSKAEESKKAEKKPEMPTEVKIDLYKGKPTFTIHRSDLLEVMGEPSFKTMVVGFGIEKAKAIVKHLDELQKFVKKNQ